MLGFWQAARLLAWTTGRKRTSKSSKPFSKRQAYYSLERWRGRCTGCPCAYLSPSYIESNAMAASRDDGGGRQRDPLRQPQAVCRAGRPDRRDRPHDDGVPVGRRRTPRLQRIHRRRPDHAALRGHSRPEARRQVRGRGRERHGRAPARAARRGIERGHRVAIPNLDLLGHARSGRERGRHAGAHRLDPDDAPDETSTSCCARTRLVGSMLSSSCTSSAGARRSSPSFAGSVATSGSR